MSKDLPVILNGLRNAGPEFAEAAKALEQNPSLFAMYALDSKMGESGFITNVTIGAGQSLSAITLEIFLALIPRQLPGTHQVLDRKIVTLDGYQAGRIVAEATIQSQRIKQLLYVFKDDSTFWIVTFSTRSEEFDRRLPSFEQSIRTFRIKLQSHSSLG